MKYLLKSKMLSSPRKIQKLFIKFTTWGKLDKAQNLLITYPDIAMPWEKAFIEAIVNKSYGSVKWLYENALALDIHLDIHYNYDQLYQDWCKNGYMYYVEWLIKCDIIYPWRETASILLENCYYKQKILDILHKYC